jgi:hypothetical protein
VTGCPALDIWHDLSLPFKEYVVTQVAHHLMCVFELRFAQAGSLYLCSNGEYTVGPIVSPKYFKAIDGEPVYTNAYVQHELHRFRGPFSSTSDWLSSPMKAEIFAFSSTLSSPPREGEHRPQDPSLALTIMNEAVRLCSKYPGDHAVLTTTTASREPFSFVFDDFSLSNIMVQCLHSVHV